MPFRYFAYGSNMWEPWLRSRCPSAVYVGTAELSGWRAVYDKPSTDGSAKLNIRPESGSSVHGVVYEIDDTDRSKLDDAEPRYTAIETEVGLTYTFEEEPFNGLPYDWYVSVVEKGASDHGITSIETSSDSDPLAAGVRPADESDLKSMMSILSDGLRDGGQRYYSHPGELGWWMYHWDERHPLTWWVQGDDAFAVIDQNEQGEIFAFARPGTPIWPLIDRCRRLKSGRGEVAWVSDHDSAFESEFAERGFEPTFDWIAYEWDLHTKPIPEPELPLGWSIRPVRGEDEAEERRRASHAAFGSSMDPARHLDRYLRFMRSPVYERERDLVVVRDDGRIASFVVWWRDETGVAQIEPFGTHPDFQRQGLGRALVYKTLAEMKDHGMALGRVCTDEPRDATDFYESVGFEVVGRLRNWDKASES